MQTLLNASAYESPALMALLYICGTLIIILVIAIKPSEQNKAPMHYYVSKRQLPSDDHHERASTYTWLAIIAGIIIYYFL